MGHEQRPALQSHTISVARQRTTAELTAHISLSQSQECGCLITPVLRLNHLLFMFFVNRNLKFKWLTPHAADPLLAFT